MWRVSRLLNAKRIGQAVVLGGTGAAAYYVYQQQESSIVESNIEKETFQQTQSVHEVSIKTVEAVQTDSTPSGQTEPEVQKVQQKVDKVEQPAKVEDNKDIGLLNGPLRRLNDIQEWSLQRQWGEDDLVLIVADVGYNETFEKRIVDAVNKAVGAAKGVRVLRKNMNQLGIDAKIEKEHGVRVKSQTIFFIKNAYDKNISNVEFDMFMQHPSVLQTYLKHLPTYSESNIDKLKEEMKSMRAHQSYLFYLYDKEEPAQKVKERLMTAKYIQMEMMLSYLKGVGLKVVERQAAVDSGLIGQGQNRCNSLHLFRKHNLFTPFEPNFYLTQSQGKSVPFYRLNNIALFAKGSSALMIPSYLSGLETFDSSQIASKYTLTLTVDRNRISDQAFTELLQVFGQLKRKDLFPDVAYQLKADKVPYGGQGHVGGKQWQIAFADLEALDNETRIFSIKSQQELRDLGYQQNTYQRDSHEHIYPHGVASFDLLKEFIKDASKGDLPRHFRSEEPHPLSKIRKVSGENISQQLSRGEEDMLLYEYSEFCPTCKKISPLISGFADVTRNNDLGLDDIRFARIDASKNRVRELSATPYIPNLYYFKKGWGAAHARFPIEFFSKGVSSLFEFCLINKEIGTASWEKLEKAVAAQQEYKRMMQL